MLREISDRSWIVENRSGHYTNLVFKTDKGYHVFEAENAGRHRFANKEELIEYFGRDIFKKVVKTAGVKERAVVNGWPCNVDEPAIDMELSKEHGLPVFRKAKTHKTVLVAGYYLYRTDSGKWSKAFCPKLETLTGAEETRGPFANETEQLGELGSLK